MSKTLGFIVGGVAIAVVLFLALWLTDVDVVDGGELPEVSVDVDGDAGELPEVDVDVAEVEFGSKEVDVKVPDVDVEMEETSIKLPTIEKVEPADAEGDEAEASPEIDPGEGDDDDQ